MRCLLHHRKRGIGFCKYLLPLLFGNKSSKEPPSQPSSSNHPCNLVGFVGILSSFFHINDNRLVALFLLLLHHMRKFYFAITQVVTYSNTLALLIHPNIDTKLHSIACFLQFIVISNDTFSVNH